MLRIERNYAENDIQPVNDKKEIFNRDDDTDDDYNQALILSVENKYDLHGNK